MLWADVFCKTYGKYLAKRSSEFSQVPRRGVRLRSEHSSGG